MYNEVKEYLRSNLSEKRYTHTLGVADECMYFADIFKLDDSSRDTLYRAALLHDITKEKTPDEHMSICWVYNIEYNNEHRSSPALFHSLTGGAFAQALFPTVCTDEVIELILTHTTGAENMTLLQKILFIADSTESTRRHESCIKLRSFFHDNAGSTDPTELLDRTIVKSIDGTISYLLRTDRTIAINTVKARNYLLTNSEVI